MNQNELIYDDENNSYTKQEVISLINSVKKDTANFIFGEANGHCNKSFRPPNDNWYPWTDNLLKQLNLNKDKLKSLLRKNGHGFLRKICLEEGGELWNRKDLLQSTDISINKNTLKDYYDFSNLEMDDDPNYGYYAKSIEICCKRINQRLASKKGMFTQWGKLEFRSILKMAGEKAFVDSKEGVSVAMLKDTVLAAREAYYKYKDEKFEIINKYYHESKF